MKKDVTAAQYDSADSTAPAAAGGDFQSDYDSAPVADAPADAPADDSQGDVDNLDIPAAEVTQMQALKDSGDMAALGTYVAKFLK